ncbi:MAG: acylneuraminate cytidylyltransferase family protein [Stygiobacter sp.]|nr:MAG: acylneuraminate cytidylyltransferase family protein [Stygiobacter sp.]
MSTLIVIQARMGSTRLPGKVLADIGGHPLLALLCKRLRLARKADRIVLAITELPGDDQLELLGQELLVPVIRGEECSLTARFMRVMQAFPADIVVRVTADNPFTDPQLVDRIVAMVEQQGMDYAHAQGTPIGTSVDAYSAATLRRTFAEATTPYQQEHLNAYVLDNPSLFRIGCLPLSPGERRSDIRVTVDTAEDLLRVRRVARLLPDPVSASLSDVIKAYDLSV